jgi:hypothetical protein
MAQIIDISAMGLFWCGYALPLFAQWVFTKPAAEWSTCRSKMRDILVIGAGGPCRCNVLTFRGTVILVNGEDTFPREWHPRMVMVGAGGLPIPYGAVEWINQNMSVYNGPVKHWAVAYANSRCVQFREDIAAKLAQRVPVHAFGKCTARGKAIRKRQAGHWTSNADRFRGYAFVIAAEHGVVKNYVTEKPFVAAAAGAVPIYRGHPLVTQYMNSDRIVFWDATTVDRVAMLLESGVSALRSLSPVNHTALRGIRAQILAAERVARRAISRSN